MKANRKFIEADEQGVSAVIGVILMVAITVAIAATVYFCVSGMIYDDGTDYRINTNHGNRGNVHSFFCGNVVIEKFKNGWIDDELRISFYEPGNYSMRFSPDDFVLDCCCDDCNNMRYFNITENQFSCHCGEPYVCSFKEYDLRHDIRVNVYLNGACESFIFD